jgi:putative FmdB family regulatory protein
LLAGAWEVRSLPIYTYACDSCGAEIERRQSFSDPPLSVCESCGRALRRVLHPVGVIFKGSGFYNTDYKNASNKNGAAATEGGAAKPAETGAGGAETAKPADKGAEKPASSPASTASTSTSKTGAPATSGSS